MARVDKNVNSKIAKILWTIYGMIALPLLFLISIPLLIIITPIFIIEGIIFTLLGYVNNADQHAWKDFDLRTISNINSEFLRLLVSIWTNRNEPMSAGGEKDRWENNHPVWRYIKWHIRNPFHDFLTYYLGFYNEKNNYTQFIVFRKGDYKGRFYLEYIIKKVPGRLFRFPYLKILYYKWTFAIGWKRRGIVSCKLNTDRY